MRSLSRLMLVLVVATIGQVVWAQPEPQNIALSDERAGSILVFPYYSSRTGTTQDTRLNITNIGTSMKTIHLFALDGNTCQQQDYFICLDREQSCALLASNIDPDVIGYAMAVVVDPQSGCPIRSNVLIGTAFVQIPAGVLSSTAGAVSAGYNAEAFYANNDPSPLDCDGITATLRFDGQIYDEAGRWLVTDIQAPIDAPGQTLVTVGLSGSVVDSDVTGAGLSGVGLIYNMNERLGSFSNFLVGNCQARAVISDSLPRVIFRLNNFLGGAGHVGTIKLPIGAGVGLLIVPQNSAGWSGIRALHKLTKNPGTALTIPVFVPFC